MRKLKLQVQMTIDGYMAGPNGEMDFMTWNWDDQLKNFVMELTKPVDCIVLGRKLAQGFIPHWAGIVATPENPEYEFARIMHDTHKVVFTKTLPKTDWQNTVLAKGELVSEITQLKKTVGGDIIAYGGGMFVSSLIQAGLIDEFNLFINPAALGRGMAVFKDLEAKQNLILKKTVGFPCGIVVVCYEPKL